MPPFAADVANVVPVVVSSIVALVGLVLTILNRRDKKSADDDKERLDMLAIGQASVVEALNLAREDNVRLRLRVVELEKAVALCTDECAEMKRALMERNP